MRRRIATELEESKKGGLDFLDVEHLAEVEVSSEVPEHPIEHALLPRYESGWRAGEPGVQNVRLWFDKPQDIRRIYLHFTEPDVVRTQEFVLRWAADQKERPREIVRQQWNFSPTGSTHEIEDYHVGLKGVTLLELKSLPRSAERKPMRHSNNFTSLNPRRE